MKKMLSLIMAAIMVLSLVACGGSSDSGAASGGSDKAASAKATPIKVATYYAESHPTSRALEEVFKPMLEEKTEGRYTVELYHNSGLGGEAEFNEGVKMGTIEMCVTGNIMGDQYPALYASDFPWVFDDVEQASYVSNHPDMIAMFQEAFDNCNMTCLGVSVNGNRCISNNKHPINKLEDLKGIKLRLPEVAHYVANFQALGATTVTMAMTEIFTALQQGTIDGQENPPTTLLANGWYEVQDYLAITNHQIAMNFVNVSTKFFESMSEADQQALRDTVDAFVAKQLELFLVAMEEDIKTLEEAGLEISYPDREEFKAAGSVVIDDFRAKYPEFDTAMKRVDELVAEYQG